MKYHSIRLDEVYKMAYKTYHSDVREKFKKICLKRKIPILCYFMFYTDIKNILNFIKRYKKSVTFSLFQLKKIFYHQTNNTSLW